METHLLINASREDLLLATYCRTLLNDPSLSKMFNRYLVEYVDLTTTH